MIRPPTAPTPDHDARSIVCRGRIAPVGEPAFVVACGHSNGVFGPNGSLTLRLTDRLGGRRLWAQDLAGTRASDITGIATVHDTEVVLSGELVQRIGLDAARSGDRSEPGLVLVVRG